MNVAKPAQSDTNSVRVINNDALFQRDSLLDLLVAIRGSSLSNEEKTEVRDLVLEYAKNIGTTDQSELQSDILKLISKDKKSFAHILDRKQPAAEQPKPQTPATTTSATTATPTINRNRPKPVFGAKSATATPVQAETTDQVNVVTKQPPAEPQPPVNPPSPTAPIAQSAPAQAAAAQATPQPGLSSVPSYIPTQTVARDPLDRIKEIKHDINEKVGNPVNLLDVDNEIGKEYMAALLDAMKKSTGGIGGIDAAMARLEQAYQASMAALSQKEIADKPALETTESAPTTAPSEESVPSTPEEIDTGRSPQPEMPEPTLEPEPSEPVKKLVPKSEEPSEAKEASEVPEGLPTAEPVKADGPTSTTATKPTSVNSLRSLAESAKLKMEAKQPRASHERIGYAAAAESESDKEVVSDDKDVEKPTESERQPAAEASPASAVADVKNRVAMTPLGPGESPGQRNVQAPKEAVSTEDKLQSDEVTRGLDQLLGEWKLFKSSGFMGMGPSGREHPLYRKLANLPMASIVSGRFEGSTPEIKQTLTDYMNGWRYEQSITHEMGESFEHYLRRVISHIIRKNKQEESNKLSQMRQRR